MLIGPRPVLLAFHTVMELRYGVLRAGWGLPQQCVQSAADAGHDGEKT